MNVMLSYLGHLSTKHHDVRCHDVECMPGKSTCPKCAMQRVMSSGSKALSRAALQSLIWMKTEEFL